MEAYLGSRALGLMAQRYQKVYRRNIEIIKKQKVNRSSRPCSISGRDQ